MFSDKEISVLENINFGSNFILVTIIGATGSTPRETGAAMLVTNDATVGTIGGGALEYDAIEKARNFINEEGEWLRAQKDYPLGPGLGQCCGGHVQVFFEKFSAEKYGALISGFKNGYWLVRPSKSGAAPIFLDENKEAVFEKPSLTPSLMGAIDGFIENDKSVEKIICKETKIEWLISSLRQKTLCLYLYGAGHVGREIVRIMSAMPAKIVWIDTALERFPGSIATNAHRLVVPEPSKVIETAPPDACHLIMTYSHALDLDIVHNILRRGRFNYLGLIGSKTKRTKFEKRLLELGIMPDDIQKMQCPIGLGTIAGKNPSLVALSVVAQLMSLDEKN